jgi:hypothetical protein
MENAKDDPRSRPSTVRIRFNRRLEGRKNNRHAAVKFVLQNASKSYSAASEANEFGARKVG